MNSSFLTRRIGIRLRNISASVLVAAVAFLVVSCADGNESGQIGVSGDQANMVFRAPARLLQSRAIVQENVILQLTIEGQVATVQPNATGQFIFRTTVTPNTSSIVSVEWLEMIGDTMLTLATASRPLNTGSVSSPVTLVFSDTEFNTSIDDDEDGFSNLMERQDGTDFADPNDPGTAPVIVALNFRFFLPAQLAGASDEIREQVSAQAFVNGEAVPLTREGDEWRGSVDVTENSDPLILANFFSSSEQTLLIASFSRSQNVGSGTNIDFLEDVYEVDEFDDDEDSFNNALETANGTDPLDARDPDGDGDGFANDADNCPIDINPDQADADNDGVGDVCDLINNLVDPDEDGISSSDFPPDNCPSDPNPNQSDIDGDGIGDVCDTSNGLDPDNDQINNPDDNCPINANNDQADVDNDLIGDVCDPFNNLTDPDQDGVSNDANPPDNCPNDSNSNQADADGDGIGDVCELPNVAPTADAGPNQMLQTGTVLQVNGSASADTDGSLDSFQWFEGPLGLATGEITSISGLALGVHLIDLVVTDNEGATDTDQLQVTITAAPVPNVEPTATAGVDQIVDEGDTVQFAGSGIDTDGTVASLEWFVDGSTIAFDTGTAASIDNLPLGETLINLVVTDNEGATGMDQLSVQVNAVVVVIPNIAPTAAAGVDQIVDEGDTVQFAGSGTDTDGTVVSLEWFVDGSPLPFDTGNTASIDDLPLGETVINLLVTDNDGDTDTDQLSVQVNAVVVVIPNIAPTATAGADQIVDEGDTVQFSGSGTDTDGTVVSLEWFVDGSPLPFGTGNTASIDDLPLGETVISLIVADNDGDTDTDQLSVEVNEVVLVGINEPPTASAGLDQIVDEGDTVQLAGSASDTDGTVVSLEWFLDGVTTPFAAGAMATIDNLPVGETLINLVVTDDDGDTGTDQLSVQVNL